MRAFLNFHPDHAELADRLAHAVADHATPVGSGTVARTKRIPVEQRAEAAVIAWLRHQTTAYDSMAIPRAQREETRSSADARPAVEGVARPLPQRCGGPGRLPAQEGASRCRRERCRVIRGPRSKLSHRPSPRRFVSVTDHFQPSVQSNSATRARWSDGWSGDGSLVSSVTAGGSSGRARRPAVWNT